MALWQSISIKLGGPQLYVHVWLLSNSMIRHSYMYHDFGHGVIIELLQDKHGESSKFEMYRGTHCPSNC